MITNRYFQARVPQVWWDVAGRKIYDRKHSMAIRHSWKLGSYPSGLLGRQMKVWVARHVDLPHMASIRAGREGR